MLVGKRLGADDFGRDFAAMLRSEAPEGGDDVGNDEQAAIGRGDLDDIGDEPADPGLVEHGDNGAALVGGREYRAPYQPRKIGAFGGEVGEAAEILLDVGERFFVERQFEQRVGVALGDA
jgi:hypothetical protein